jgi:hypothetical protein
VSIFTTFFWWIFVQHPVIVVFQIFLRTYWFFTKWVSSRHCLLYLIIRERTGKISDQSITVDIYCLSLQPWLTKLEETDFKHSNKFLGPPVSTKWVTFYNRIKIKDFLPWYFDLYTPKPYSRKIRSFWTKMRRRKM